MFLFPHRDAQRLERRRNILYEYIEEFYNVDEVLTKNDNFVIVIFDKPNDTLIQLLKNIWEQENIFITIFSINHTLFNILEHSNNPIIIIDSIFIYFSYRFLISTLCTFS